MGIGIFIFIEVVGVGFLKDFDILGVKMFDSVEIWVYFIGKVIVCFGIKLQGQGYEIIYVQIVVEELGILMEYI